MRRVTVGRVYLPEVIQEFFNTLGCLPQYHNITALGDINKPDVNWQSMSSTNSLGNLFCELAFNLNLIQVISEPTHIHGNPTTIIVDIIRLLHYLMH
jgi:hypothetical protein